MNYLRQSSGISIILGPFLLYSSDVDALDSVLISAGTTPALLRQNSGTTVCLAERVWEVISGSSGYYRLDLSNTDTGVTGPLTIAISGASAVASSFKPVTKDYEVISPHYYDFIHGDTGYINTSAVSIGGVLVGDGGVTVAAFAGSLVGDTGVTVATITSAATLATGVTTNWLSNTRVSDSGVTVDAVTSGCTIDVGRWGIWGGDPR